MRKRDDKARNEYAVRWLEDGRGCISCGTLMPDIRGYSTHHILGGNCGRPDVPTNWWVACGQCHDLAEGRQIRDPRTKLIIPPITLGQVIAIKLIRDHENTDLRLLAAIQVFRLSPLEPIPGWIESAYKRNCPAYFRPWHEDHLEILHTVNQWIDSYEIVR